MATHNSLLKKTLPVAADYSAKQYYLMVDSSSVWTLAATAGARVQGVLNNDPDTADEHGCCDVAGLVKAVSGGSVSIGDPLTVDSSGRAVTADAPWQHVWGYAIESSAAAGTVIQALMSQGGADGLLNKQHVRLKTFSFTAAQVIAADATPLVILDHSAMITAGEIASGDVLLFEEAIIQMNGGSANYDQNQNTIAKYQTAGGGATVSTTLANFFNGAADGAMSTLKQLVTDITPEADQDIVLTSSASPKNSAGDRPVAGAVAYSVYTPV